MTDCIDLRHEYGDEYRVSHEESYDHERTEFRSAEEPWLQVIRCHRGHICPWGVDHLAYCGDRRGRAILRRVRELPYVSVVQDGSDGANVLFPADRFSEVALIVRAKRRYYMTPEQRTAAVARLAKYQYSAADKCVFDAPGRVRAA